MRHRPQRRRIRRIPQVQRNVLEYLEATAPRLPDKIAFSNGTDSLTFGQLSRAARGIGTWLAGQGLSHEPVVVFMEKHPRSVAAFFGVVYSGCFYVPIDEEMPAYRVELIFQTLKPRAVLCDQKTRGQVEAMGYQGILCGYETAAACEPDDGALARIRAAQLDTDPLYIVFTSGSTGVPKGVVACHRSVIDYIEQLSATLGFSQETVFGNQTPLYFDACLKELYPTIKFGATTYLIPKGLFLFPIKLVDYLNEHRINTVCWVVSALTMISGFRVLEKQIPEYLHTIAFGSEVFPIRQFQLWRAALPNAKFTNLYGPTEATGMSCFYHVDRDFEADEVIPIGQPFPNTGILLLTEDNREAAPGELGEICIKGTCLTMGYYRMPEKTAECFVQNPLNDAYPELIYRTGDLGRYNERGELVFVSRKDYQIKHMGHRIELQEIEVVAAMHPETAQACAIYDKEKDKILLYYTGTAETAALTAFLKEKLPRYMLPNKMERLERMPLTPNGKADRKALSAT
ncbi:MAG TPA: amino acid adenylation domain-containing protein [Candidatus Flavonifractor merdavium]|nr:amino acid adenylation domain-containing protein [Candidatus Flavonifractor merdavium]